jgi:hypothetical protein
LQQKRHDYVEVPRCRSSRRRLCILRNRPVGERTV